MTTGPQRLVCLTEETTETLYLLGEERRIVGISAFTVRPPQARREKPVVSQFVRAKVGRIIELRPDLVLAFSDIQAEICAELIKAGLEVHCFNQRSVAEILESIRALGRLIGCGAKAAALARRLERGLEALRRTAAARFERRPRIYFEEWPDPMICGIRWVSELIEIAGGVDIFADRRSAGLAQDRVVSAAEVFRRAPDLYLASWCGKKFRPDQARSRPGFATAPFTREERMVEISSAIILQPGPAALTDGVRALHREIARVAALGQVQRPAPARPERSARTIRRRKRRRSG